MTLGSVRRAARDLEASPLAPMDDSTIARLRALHPASPAFAMPAFGGQSLVATTENLTEALRRAPAGPP